MTNGTELSQTVSRCVFVDSKSFLINKANSRTSMVWNRCPVNNFNSGCFLFSKSVVGLKFENSGRYTYVRSYRENGSGTRPKLALMFFD